MNDSAEVAPEVACRTFVALDARASTADAPVWVQIARSGQFKGHAAGPFELNAALFTEIVRNFREVDGAQIPFDFEHASEAPATEGSIPTGGAPAQGWIRDLKVEGADLWALVEWLEPAKSYIRAGKYKWVSPAIRFNAKHPETGKPIGARLTSVALTNGPFLRQLKPVTAKDQIELWPAVPSEGPGPGEWSHVLKTVATLTDLVASERRGADAERVPARSEETTTMAEAVQQKDLEAQKAELTLKLSEASARAEALEAEVKLLRDWRHQREEAELRAEVDGAFETYKDSHKLTDAQREDMLVLARASLEAFRRLYPKVAPAQRHLLREIAAARPAEIAHASSEKPTLRALTDKFMREERLTLEEAQCKAARELGIRKLVVR